MGKRSYKAVIIDFDGTLMDSLPLVAGGWKHSAKKHFGKDIPIEQVTRQLHGPAQEIYSRMRKLHPDSFHPEKIDDFLKDKEIWMDENRKLGKLFSDSLGFIEGCERKGLKIALVTSSRKAWVYAYPSFREIEKRFDALVFWESAKSQKPSPEPLLLASKMLGIAPADILSIGDGPPDALASVAAGMDFVGVTTGTSDERELKAAGAKRAFASLGKIMDGLL